MNIEEEKSFAEFMEFKTQDSTSVREIPRTDYFVTIHGVNRWVREDYLQFHDSWEWLMAVLEKINTIAIVGTSGDSATALVISSHIDVGMRTVNKTHTYNAMLSFIKWYNEHK